MPNSPHICIIGAGIVGLATGLQLLRARPGLRVSVIEKEDRVSAHQSGHNSGVIHSGVYYKPGSLRAVNCQTGYRQLLAFAREHDLPHDICGKVIVATRPEEVPQLRMILERGIANGMKGLKMIGPEAIREHEPHVRAVQGIWVPQAGIIDYAQVARKYAELIEQLNGAIFYRERVESIQVSDREVQLETNRNTHRADLLINCAGLYSDRVAAMTGQQLDLQILPFRGEYYELKPERAHLVNNLIYPVPDPNFPFLGVHFTRMIGGGIEAGPNAVLAFRREGYDRFDVDRAELWETLRYSGFQKLARKYWKTGLAEQYRSFSSAAFARALQHLIPEIRRSDLVRGGAGVRAMACGPNGELLDDYVIYESNRVVNVCNAPSPAATSSLAIGQTIVDRALRQFD